MEWMLNIDRVARLQKQPPPLWVLGRVSSARRGNVENRGSRRAEEGAEGRQGRVIDRGWKGWRYDAPSDVIALYNPLELPAGALSFTSSPRQARLLPRPDTPYSPTLFPQSSFQPLLSSLHRTLSVAYTHPSHPATLSRRIIFALLRFDSRFFWYALLSALRRCSTRCSLFSPDTLTEFPVSPSRCPRSSATTSRRHRRARIISAEYGAPRTSRGCLRGNHTAAVAPKID